MTIQTPEGEWVDADRDDAVVSVQVKIANLTSGETAEIMGTVKGGASQAAAAMSPGTVKNLVVKVESLSPGESQ